MKKILLIGLTLLTSSSFAWTSWEDSPMNWKNSDMNYENSSMNWKNSSMNWENSSMNPNSRGIYDADGNRSGYIVPKSGGGFNMFDNQGNRMGYGR